MYSTERLKTAYKRHNQTEQSFLCLLVDNVPDLTILRGKLVLDLKRCKAEYRGKNVLILDMKTTNLTDKGRYRTIEFCFINKKGKVHWVDAKQAKTTTNICDLHGEYDRAANNKGITTYVVEGDGYTENVITSHQTYLKKLKIDDKVKVIPLTEIRKIINTYFN